MTNFMEVFPSTFMSILPDRGRLFLLKVTIRCWASRPSIWHEEFVEPSKKYADVIIPEGGFNSVAVAMLIQNISSLIARNE